MLFLADQGQLLEWVVSKQVSFLGHGNISYSWGEIVILPNRLWSAVVQFRGFYWDSIDVWVLLSNLQLTNRVLIVFHISIHINSKLHFHTCSLPWHPGPAVFPEPFVLLRIGPSSQRLSACPERISGKGPQGSALAALGPWLGCPSGLWWLGARKWVSVLQEVEEVWWYWAGFGCDGARCWQGCWHLDLVVGWSVRVGSRLEPMVSPERKIHPSSESVKLMVSQGKSLSNKYKKNYVRNFNILKPYHPLTQKITFLELHSFLFLLYLH